MKYFVLLLILVTVVGSISILSDQNAHGLWVPRSPQELMEQSKIIFVGTITEITPVDVEYQSQIARNGTMKESVGPETMTLEEYTVSVEEYLKNPQDTDTVKVLRATVSGVPSGPARISGFEIGDRVLFYLPQDEGQTHFSGQYMPESFEIPKDCDAKSVMEQKRIEGRNAFSIFQDGIMKKDTFTANTPMKFVFGKDTATLFGASMQVDVAISKKDKNQPLFEKTSHAEAEPCQWITSAEWEFTPQEGNYWLRLSIKEDGNRGATTSHTGFSAISDTSDTLSPLKQFESGISADKIKCKDDLVLILKYDKTPACVTPDTKMVLIKRGWADSTTPVSNDDCSRSMRGYQLSKPLSEVYVQRLVLFIQPDSSESFCVFYKSNLENSGNHTLNPTLDTGGLENRDSSDVSITFEPKKVSLEYGSKTLVKYNVKTTPNAEGVYLIGIDQLGRLPVVVWEDRKSVGANEIPVYHGFSSSENKVLDSVILWHDEDDSLEYVLAKIER